MSQEFQVMRCFSCNTFQVHQVKKSKKWNCKLCGEKQSIVKVYAQGSGACCRHHVQQLNMIRGELETAQNELVQHLYAPPLLSDSKHQAGYNGLENYANDKNQHSRWTQYTESSADEEAETQCSVDDDSTDMIYTTDRMLFKSARQRGKRKKKVQSSDEGYTDDDLETGQKKKYVNRSNTTSSTLETMNSKPFINFSKGSHYQYQKPKPKVVETFNEANTTHLSSAIRNDVLDGENNSESFGYADNKYQNNRFKWNTIVDEEISSEIPVNNENIDVNKSNIPVGLDPCIKNSPFDEIHGSKTFYRDAQSNNEFESRDQSCRLRTGNQHPSSMKSSEKTTGRPPVKTSTTENLSKLSNQSKWSRFIEECIDDENNVHCGEASSQQQSEKYEELQFLPSDGADKSSVFTNGTDLHLKYNLEKEEKSNMNAKRHMNPEYGHVSNFGEGLGVFIYQGKQNMFLSSGEFVKNCSKQSELHIRSHTHKDDKGCEISAQKETAPKSGSRNLFTVGDISDDEFEL